VHEGVEALIGILMAFVSQVEGEHRGFELRVPQVALDEPRIDARFQQLRGERVPEGISTLLIMRR
jgi:hypothetical protein